MTRITTLILLNVQQIREVVLQSTVFASIVYPDLKRRVAAEMMRVVKPDGFMLWYDYHVNNPWNPEVRGVKTTRDSTVIPQLSG